MIRCESQPRVKPDVVDSARHRLETDHAGTLLAKPLDPLADDFLAQSVALLLGTNGERTHPSFGARLVHHVKRGDRATVIAPDHRAQVGILDRIAPDRRIEERHPDTGQAVAAISLRKSRAEDLVQFADTAQGSPMR